MVVYCCNGFSESYDHGAVYSASRLSSTQHSLIEQPLEQPNINLQVTLTQRWPGLNALLVDVAPYCLLANECDLELTLVEENGGSWRIPAGKTFSPPFFSEVNFLLGIISYITVIIFCRELFRDILTLSPLILLRLTLCHTGLTHHF